MKILNGWITLMLCLCLVAGCATSSRSIPFLVEQRYTTLDRDGAPALSITGVSEGWIIYPSSLERGIINAHRHAYDENGSQYGSVSLHVSVGYRELSDSNDILRGIRSTYFVYDRLINQNYEQQAEFIKAKQYHEKIRREVGYRKVIVEPVSFRSLQCMGRFTARSVSPHGGYGLQKSVDCPIVVNSHTGGFGFTLTINHWRATLEDLQAHYGEDYLKIVFRELEESLKTTLESLIFHVDFSQDPNDLQGYNFPPVPDGMTYTDFYLDVIPEQFHLLSPPNVLPWNRILTPEDIVRMKSKGLTLPIAQEWKLFFENARSERESHLRSTRAPNGRVRTEEGIQISLRELTDMVRLFSETIETWDQVPGTNE